MASKKSDRVDRLVYILEHANSWVSASMLARMLDTSERTIRNYVTEINGMGDRRIESSSDGYRLEGGQARHEVAEPLAPGPRPPKASSESSAVVRRNYVLSRLVNAREGMSFFDLAEELHISESTLASNVMPQVRRLLERYDLAIETRSFTMRLEGREQDKRRLLGHLATHDSGGYFSSPETLEELFPDFDVRSILASLVGIFQHSSLLINDFALRNLLMHLLVIVIRLRSNHELAEMDSLMDINRVLDEFGQSDEIVRCARCVADYFEREFGFPMPEADHRQIVLLIALSVERYDYEELSLDALAQLMDQRFTDLVRSVASETAARYGIPAFDETLLLQLTLHLYNAHQRATYHVSYPNPLAEQIKHDYAPVYDMAVHFTHRFSHALGCAMDENEIAFIAFHIGGYLERCSETSNTATCVIVVRQYHDFASKLIEGVTSALNGDATIVGIMGVDEYRLSPPECDLVITTQDVDVPHGRKVVVGPILTKRTARQVREQLDEVLSYKETLQARRFLRGMLSPSLFSRNVYLPGGQDSYIDYLGGLAMSLGYADEGFVQDVHLREGASSTAFVDGLAVPHSISAYARRSFIAVLHNDSAVPWGRHSVHFVLLIGIAREDMKYFRDAFDLIVELFSSVDRTVKLMKTDSYEEFLGVFTRELE